MTSTEPIVDIGSNLGNKAFREDLDDVLRRARAAGVGAIVATGTTVPGSRRAWEIAESAPKDAPRLYATAGIHPHHGSTYGPDAIVALRELCARKEVVAVGECGLDFDRNFSPPDAQRACFEGQLELAIELQMPVFLHERSAHADFVAILERHRSRLTKAVVHCFTGTKEILDRYLAMDLHIGLTGWICDERRGQHLVDIVGRIPKHRLMIETDAPYILPRDMKPKPKSGRNEPMYLPHVLRTIARARGEAPEELARSSTATARAFFGIEVSGQ